MEKINFHYVTLFIYQMAEIYAYHGEKKWAIEQLTRYVEVTERVLSGEINYLQSDDYLDRLHIWFEGSVLSGNFPRDKRIIYDGMIRDLEASKFDILKNDNAFLALQKKEKEMEKY